MNTVDSTQDFASAVFYVLLLKDGKLLTGQFVDMPRGLCFMVMKAYRPDNKSIGSGTGILGFEGAVFEKGHLIWVFNAEAVETYQELDDWRTTLAHPNRLRKIARGEEGT